MNGAHNIRNIDGLHRCYSLFQSFILKIYTLRFRGLTRSVQTQRDLDTELTISLCFIVLAMFIAIFTADF